MIPPLKIITRSKATSLLVHEEEESSISRDPPCFLDLEQITRNTMKITPNNIAKSMKFDPLVEELSF